MSSHFATLMRVEDERGVRCVVTHADPVIWIAAALIAEVRSGKHTGLEGGAVLDGDLLTFGTEGEGLGRLRYRLVGRDEVNGWHIARREDTDGR